MRVGIFESLPMSMVEDEEESSSMIFELMECLAKESRTLPSLNWVTSRSLWFVIEGFGTVEATAP